MSQELLKRCLGEMSLSVLRPGAPEEHAAFTWSVAVPADAPGERDRLRPARIRSGVSTGDHPARWTQWHGCEQRNRGTHVRV